MRRPAARYEKQNWDLKSYAACALFKKGIISIYTKKLMETRLGRNFCNCRRLVEMAGLYAISRRSSVFT